MPDAPQKRALVFAAEEYRLRVDSLCSAMVLQEIDALVLSEPANIAWTTGYDAVAFDGPVAVIVTLQEDPRWWGPERDAAGAAASVWMAEDALSTYAETGARHPFVDLGAALSGLGLSAARIGVEFDSAHVSAGAIGALLEALPNARYVDATALADWRRVVKSDAEIALMRQAALLADAGQEAALKALTPGRAVGEALSEIAGALAPGGAAPVAPTLLSGPEIAARALPAAHGSISDNAPHAVVLAGVAAGYCCPVARTVCLGAPSGEIADAATRAADAFDAALAVAKPGAPAGEIADAFLAALKSAGAPAGPVGFSVGRAAPPRWRERNLRLVAGEATELLEGMTLWLSAGPALTGAQIRIDETFLVTAEGAQALSATPREVAVKG